MNIHLSSRLRSSVGITQKGKWVPWYKALNPIGIVACVWRGVSALWGHESYPLQPK